MTEDLTTFDLGPGTHVPQGCLPRPLPHFVATPLYTELAPRLQFATIQGGWTAVAGDVGLGKTQATAQALRDLGHPTSWIQMSTDVSARGHLAAIWRGLTGTRAIGTLSDIREDLISALTADTSQVLAMDDAHFIPRSGLRVLVSVWNEVALQAGQGIPIVLIGNGLIRHLSGVPEALSRLKARIEASPLQGETLLTVLTELEPRLASTDRALLRDVDRRFLKGELRQWVAFIEAIRITTKPTDRLDTQEVAAALSLCGFIQNRA